MTNQREGAFDMLKLFLIFSVCISHLINIDLYSTENDINLMAFRFLHSINMPLFVFLSGMFFRKKETKEMLKGIYPMLGAYLIFQVLTPGKILTYSGGGISWFINGWQYNVTHLYDPADALWYIISLPFWRIFLNSTPDRIIKKPLLTIGIALCFSFCAGFVPLSRIMSFQRTFAFYPYFLLGYYLKSKVTKLSKLNILFPVIIFIAYIFIISVVKPPIDGLMSQTQPYNDMASVLSGVIKKIIFYVWPIPLMVAALVLVQKMPKIKYVEQEGMHTVFYYLYHMFYVLLFRILVIHYGLPNNLIVIFVYGIMCFVIMRQMRKCHYLVWITNPSLKGIRQGNN